MYELTIKQKLTNYCYFLLINTGIATIISCRYLLTCNNFQLDASTIFFWFSNHISYMLLMSLFIGIIGSLGFIFKSNNKQQLFQAITVALALILLFVDMDIYIRNKSHLYIGYFPVYFAKISFYLTNRSWFVLFIVVIPLLIYIEYFLIKWIAKQTWLLNKKPLINLLAISFITIVLIQYVFYVSLPNNKKELVNNISAYIPKFTIANTNNKNILQNIIEAIKVSYKYTKVLKLANAEDKFNKIYEFHLWGKGAGLYIHIVNENASFLNLN